MFRGDFVKQLGHPRINVIRRICPRTHAEYKIIPLVDKSISVNVRSCEVLHESKCNLAASILWAEHCHLQGHSVVTTALFQHGLCCSHGDRRANNLNARGGTFTDSRFKSMNQTCCSPLLAKAVGTPAFFAGVRRINPLNLEGKMLKEFLFMHLEKEGFLLHSHSHKAMKIKTGQALVM